MSSSPPASSSPEEGLTSVCSSLCPLIFVGRFDSRVFREDYNGYRDEVRVDEGETNVIKAVRSAAKKIKRIAGVSNAVGIESKDSHLVAYKIKND